MCIGRGIYRVVGRLEDDDGDKQIFVSDNGIYGVGQLFLQPTGDGRPPCRTSLCYLPLITVNRPLCVSDKDYRRTVFAVLRFPVFNRVYTVLTALAASDSTPAHKGI